MTDRDPRVDVTIGELPLSDWLFLEGNRMAIAAAVVLFTFFALLGVVQTYGLDAVQPRSPLSVFVSALITGNLTLITVVLAINQLVLSRELGPPGDLQQRIERTVRFRNEVEETTEAGVAPNAPPEFLEHLNDSVRSRAEVLDDAIGDIDDADLRSRVRGLIDSLVRDVEIVDRTLERGAGRIFTVVSATLETNHSDQLHDIAVIRHRHSASLTRDLEKELVRIEDLLLQMDVARRYFKTIYVLKELSYLSRVLLYVGFPAILVGSLTLVFINAALIVTVSDPVLFGIVAITFTLGFAPLAVLFSFVLRLSWVAQKTVTMAPFASEPEYSP